jgi:hypothetical protein
MTGWYPGWQVVIAWLLAVAVAGVIYFVPVTQLVDNLSDHPTTGQIETSGPVSLSKWREAALRPPVVVMAENLLSNP